MFTNHQNHGGNFGDEINSILNQVISAEIAVGYFGIYKLKKLKPELLDIARRGFCKILIGMIYHEGVKNNYERNFLYTFDQELKAINANSGIFISTRKYHGKIYKFEMGEATKIYTGSSNLSDGGFSNTLEFNSQLSEVDKINTNSYLNWLFNNREISQPLSFIKLKIKSDDKQPSIIATNNRPNNLPTTKKKSLIDLIITKQAFPTAQAISSQKITLRVDEQKESSLNLCFDKGRVKKGIYTPRKWYEVEITCNKTDITNSNYPKGDFEAYVKNGNIYYKINMITASSGYKAITSKGNRLILGELIKGKLEEAGLLEVNETITSEILAEYGRDFIELKKFAPNKYYLEF